MLYLLWHSKLRIKKCTPSLFSHSSVGEFTSKWLGKDAHNKQRKVTPTLPLWFHMTFMWMPCSLSIYRVRFFNIWFNGPTSERVWMQRRHKSLLKYIYWFYRAEKVNSRICLNSRRWIQFSGDYFNIFDNVPPTYPSRLLQLRAMFLTTYIMQCTHNKKQWLNLLKLFKVFSSFFQVLEMSLLFVLFDFWKFTVN